MAELCRKKAHPPVGCVIMASGLSTRFGSNKLLADFGGRPMLCRALDGRCGGQPRVRRNGGKKLRAV